MNGKRSEIEVTGGDKGSKKSNDFEASGRDRNVDQGERHPENVGRVGIDMEKRSRPKRGRTTEAGVVASNESKNHSQIAAQPEPGKGGDKKRRRTSKGEKGSRKPGTELTKEEGARLGS